MEAEKGTCQNCKNDFAIEADDLAFYGKIGVPPPTFCPMCRRQRRMAFINFTHLHRRKCDLCGKESISKYPQDAQLTTYCPKCWNSDKWDPLSYGRDYDFSRPFFEQFSELLRTVPVPTLDIDFVAAETSPFANHAGNIKNCYLVFFSAFSEDCMYGFYMEGDRSLLDTSLAIKCDLCYDSENIFKDNRCVGVKNVSESIDCFFLKDSTNCQNCFASVNLRNKKYHIFNQPYSKEEYEKEIGKWDLGSYAVYQDMKKKAEEHWQKYPPKPVFDDFSVNCTGNYIFESKNCKECYEVSGAQDCKYLMMMVRGPVRDCYDITAWGDNLSQSYESYIGSGATRMRFCFESNSGELQEGEYSMLSSSSYLFGCVSTRQARYCILNKLYSEKDYKDLRARIIQHMDEMPYVDKMGRTYKYGEFFPAELSWVPYNESLAQTFFPLTKEQVLRENLDWRDPEVIEHTTTRKTADLPDHIKDAGDDILQDIIACETCPRAYRIIQDELQMLRTMNLPLPRRCPLCRIEGRIAQWAKQIILIERVCDNCQVRFKTHCREEDAPHILCKECWLAEVA